MTETFDETRAAFFARWVERHPEEASTLGIHEGALSDPSLEAIESEARELRATLDVLERTPGGDPLDRWAIESWARHQVRRVERGEHVVDVELGLLPYELLRHFLVHASDTELVLARKRLAGIPAFLAAHERKLARGVSDARAVRGTVEWIARRSIRGVVHALREELPRIVGDPDVCGRAADAYEAHGRFLCDRVLPEARESGSIGVDETRLRLRSDLAIERSADALIADARAVLERAHDEMFAWTRRHDDPIVRKPGSLAEMAEAVSRLYDGWTSRDPDGIVATYEGHVSRAAAFARAHGLVPEGMTLSVRVRIKPPAIADGTSAQNWAAPLRARSPVADFCVSPDHSAHAEALQPILAVHEGIPGHALQSLCFARAHGSSASPVRFLTIADDVAMARSYFGAMLSIEGWATWAEHRMLELGFYEGRAELYAWSVRALRAARVIADLSIHTGAVSAAEAAAFMENEAPLPRGHASSEVARYQRIPLQALTYLTGALQIERALARGVSIDELLAAGPVPPDLVGAHDVREKS